MRLTVSKIISLLLALAMAVSLPGCTLLTDEEVDEMRQDDPEVIVGRSIGQELVPSYKADDVFSLNYVSNDSFNPYQAESTWNKLVGMLAYEPLVNMDRNFEAEPNLVTRWETQDGINWVFYVDTSRRFHSGGQMTAADAVYSLQQAMYSSTRYSRRFANVAGASSIDNESFAVVLTRANYRFYQLLNIPCIEYGAGGESRPSGTGPYKFNAKGTRLERDKNYPTASDMPLDTIYLKEYAAADDILQAFEDSLIDLVVNNPSDMASLGYSSTNITRYMDTTSLHYLGFNMQSSLFGQPIYRVLMTYAVDRENIVYSAMQGAGVATTLPIHPNSPLYPSDIADTLDYSENGFITALNNTSAADIDFDGILEFGGAKMPIDFVVCSDSGAKVSAARMIANQLQNAGFTVNLRELAYDGFVNALSKGDFDMYYAEVKICNDWDLTWLLSSEAALNYGGVKDAELEGLIQTFLNSADEASQTENARQLCQYLAMNAPIVPVCFERTEALYHRGVISGMEPTQDSLFYHMENWTVELE